VTKELDCLQLGRRTDEPVNDTLNMLTSLLAASDLSSRSTPAVRRAIQLAVTADASLGVLHVVEDDQPAARMQEEMRSAMVYLEEAVNAMGRPTHCDVFTRAGDAFQIICDEAQLRDVDLIVVGAHRRQLLRDVFVGTTVERVVRTAARPVLMANGRTGERWTKVIIAIDLSVNSAAAARTARRLGLLDGADVTFVHAYAPLTRQMMTYAGVAEERVREEAEREYQATRRKITHFIEALGFDNVRYSVRIIEGLGAAAIAGVVEQAKADLLVIGTRGLSGVKRVFLGSLAQDLMSRLEIDILAVPLTR